MIQQIYDRVPTKPNRKKITFESDGRVEYATVEYADEPTTEGIPYNGFFASNLQGDLYTLDRSVLPDSTEIIEGTTASFTLNKSLTSYETGKLLRLRCPTVSGAWAGDNITFAQLGLESLSASSVEHNIYNAIDGLTDTYWNNADTEYQNVWLRFNFKSAIKIKKLKIKIRASGSDSYFASGKLQGSNNGTSWTDLYTLSSSSQFTEITLTSPANYKYYRILASTTSSTRSIQVYEVQVTEYEGNNYMLYRPLININSLGDKTIYGTLYAGRDYLLRYSGSGWDIVEALNNYVTGTLAITRDTSIPVDVGFKPKLVILYSASNNVSGVATASTNPSNSYIPIIITDQYSGGKVALTSTGFTINESASIDRSILYYIAIG